jgi:Protein of unknown function (DUF4239)
MSAGLIIIVIIGASVLCAVAGLLWVRRLVPLSFLETHHEVAGFFISVLSVIYAVLLGFVILVVWSDFEEIKEAVVREASQLGDILHMARGFPTAVQQQVQQEITTYVHAVVDDEWPAMAQRQVSTRAQSAMASLWHTYMALEPTTTRENALYAETLDRLHALSETRRLRLHASRDKIPRLMWVLLWAGGLITILFTYFFGVQSIRSQVLMTTALTAVIAFVLLLIVALEQPFTGLVRLTPEVFLEALEDLRVVPPTLAQQR